MVEKPSALNTGYLSSLAELELNPIVGDYTITTPGTVFETYTMSGGRLRVSANNVTIRDGIHESGDFFNIQVDGGITGTVIENVELKNASSEAIRDGGNGTIIRKCHITEQGGDGIKPVGFNTIIELNYFDKLGNIEGAHADGIQILDGWSNITIRHNTFNMIPDLVEGEITYSNDQCIIVSPTCDNIQVYENWINGGGFSINISPFATNSSIRSNLFGFDFSFGPYTSPNDHLTIVGNKWEVGGTYQSVTYSAGDFLPPPNISTSLPRSYPSSTLSALL